jgi:hypothetical protein
MWCFICVLLMHEYHQMLACSIDIASLDVNLNQILQLHSVSCQHGNHGEPSSCIYSNKLVLRQLSTSSEPITCEPASMEIEQHRKWVPTTSFANVQRHTNKTIKTENLSPPCLCPPKMSPNRHGLGQTWSFTRNYNGIWLRCDGFFLTWDDDTFFIIYILVYFTRCVRFQWHCNCRSSLPSASSDSNSFPFWHHTVSRHRLARTSADIPCVTRTTTSRGSQWFFSNTADTVAWPGTARLQQDSYSGSPHWHALL